MEKAKEREKHYLTHIYHKASPGIDWEWQLSRILGRNRKKKKVDRSRKHEVNNI